MDRSELVRSVVRPFIAIFLVVMTIQGIYVCEIVSMRTSPTMGFNMVWVFIITPITAVLQLVFLALMTIEDIADGGMWGKSLVTRPHNRLRVIAIRNPR